MSNIRFKVLKVHSHVDRSDALDLKPFLDDVDFSSIELDFCPEQMAKGYEMYIKLKQDKITNDGIRKFESILERSRKKPMGAYITTLLDILIEKNIPLFVLERTEDSESERLNKMANPPLMLDINAALGGNLDSVCNQVFEHYEELKRKRRDERDWLMGMNAKKYYDAMYNHFSHLLNKSELVYAVPVGVSHSPEIYFMNHGFDVQVIDVPSSKKNMNYNVYELMGVMSRNGASKDDMKNLLATRALVIMLHALAGKSEAEIDSIERRILGKTDYNDIETVFKELSRCIKDPEGYVTDKQMDVVINYVNGLLR